MQKVVKPFIENALVCSENRCKKRWRPFLRTQYFVQESDNKRLNVLENVSSNLATLIPSTVEPPFIIGLSKWGGAYFHKSQFIVRYILSIEETNTVQSVIVAQQKTVCNFAFHKMNLAFILVTIFRNYMCY